MNELSKNLMCIQMRTGVELWVEGDKAEKLQDILQLITKSKFIRYEGQTINSADVVGVFSAHTMEELTRRKNGEWKCKYGTWHEKRGECSCWQDHKNEEKSPLEIEVTEEQHLRNVSALADIRKKFISKTI